MKFSTFDCIDDYEIHFSLVSKLAFTENFVTACSVSNNKRSIQLTFYVCM